MPSLILELATDHGNHYEVLDEARNVVGHIMLSDAAPPEMPWIWSISSGHHAGRKPTYGYEATCEAAMEAFARVWHREFAQAIRPASREGRDLATGNDGTQI